MRSLFDLEGFQHFLAENGQLGRDLVKHFVFDGPEPRRYSMDGMLHFECEMDLDGCGLHFMVNFYAPDKKTLGNNICLIQENGWLKC